VAGTALVVDDDPDVRTIAAIFLREAGYMSGKPAAEPKHAISLRQARSPGTRGLRHADHISGFEFPRLASRSSRVFQ
jgi:hypothetical protein